MESERIKSENPVDSFVLITDIHVLQTSETDNPHRVSTVKYLYGASSF
jgi:hypothetical protein